MNYCLHSKPWMISGLILSAVYAGATMAQRPKLKPLKPGGVEFSIDMPGEPTRIGIFIPLNDMAVRTFGWESVSNNVRYHVVAFSKSQAAFHKTFALFSEELERVFIENHASLSKDGQVATNGQTAFQYHLKSTSYSALLRLYEGKEFFYAVVVTGENLETNVSAQSFLESFKLGSLRDPSVDPSARNQRTAGLPASPWDSFNFANVKTIDVGVLNGKAIELPGAKYPKGARGRGSVIVRILVDEHGFVAAATAEDGPNQFYDEATQAARKARFQPTSLNGRPIKVSGILTYNFVD